MKNIQLFVLLGVIVVLSGCAGQKGAPSFALLQPELGISAIHPVEMDEKGDAILTFIGIWPIELAVETDETLQGVFPIVATSLNSDVPFEKGFCYTMPEQAFGNNPWGEVPMRCVFIGNRGIKERFVREERSMALFNKDGGVFVASPIGITPGFEHTILDDKTYDYSRFESDLDYQKELMREIGRTVPVIEKTWKERIEVHGLKAKNDLVQEIVIDEGVEWANFTKKMIADMGGGLEMTDGTKVTSFLSEVEMQSLMSKNPEISKWQKFMAHFRVSLGLVAMPEMMALDSLSSMINGGIAVLFDNTWNAKLARGTAERRYASDTFALLFNQYQRAQVGFYIERERRGGGE